VKQFFAYAIGAAIVDTELEVTDQDLTEMRVDKGLMTLVDEARQQFLLTHLHEHMVRASHASGGSAGNSMIATALFGAPTYMSCKVAGDADGDIYLNDLEASGVAHGHLHTRLAGTTGKCIVLVTPDAERSMNTFLGISESLSTNEVDETAIAASEWVYLEGYLVTSPSGHAAALKTKEIAQEQGVKTALSFADPGMVKFFRENMAQLVGDGVDLIFCNEAEALEWGQTNDLREAMDHIRAAAKTFVITRGAKGAITFDGHTVSEIPAPNVRAVNTNGAGDMFAGAFLYALSRGEDYARAGEFAALAAAEVVQFFGPRLNRAQCERLRQSYFGQ
jgi:sugar/nucleoside kinase (ribokinase family)